MCCLVSLLVSAVISIISGIALIFKYINVSNGIESINTWFSFITDTTATLLGVGAVGIVTLVFSQTFGRRTRVKDRTKETMYETARNKFPELKKRIDETDFIFAEISFVTLYELIQSNDPSAFFCQTNTKHSKLIKDLIKQINIAYSYIQKQLDNFSNIKYSFSFFFDIPGDSDISYSISKIYNDLCASSYTLDTLRKCYDDNYDFYKDQNFVENCFSQKDFIQKMAKYEEFNRLHFEIEKFEKESHSTL